METMSFLTKVNNPISLLGEWDDEFKKNSVPLPHFFNKYVSSKKLKIANYNYF